MEYPIRHPEENQKKMSRSRFLHDSAIAATGVVLIPSIIAGCRKLNFYPGHGKGPVGDLPLTPLTPDELAIAAENIKKFHSYITKLYPFCIEYELVAFLALDSTNTNGSWKNFIIDVFIDIGLGLAAAISIATGGAAVMPAIACFAAFLKDWGFGKGTPSNLHAEFSAFIEGHNQMQWAIEEKLNSLEDSSNNYHNLSEHWKDNIEYNGQTYTIRDLFTSDFPTTGDDYNKLLDSGYTHFKKSLWNLIVIKTCTLYRHYPNYYVLNKDYNITDYAQNEFYSAYKGSYLRVRHYNVQPPFEGYNMYFWYLGINKYSFPDVAAKILFMDDTPGHIINPDGLFNRSYVFEQFNTQKPDFSYYADELATFPEKGLAPQNNDWEFTGGMFPVLADI